MQDNIWREGLRKLRICVVGTRGIPNVQGGVEKHCEELYSRLQDLGCEIIVFARGPYTKKNNRPGKWKGIQIRYIWCPRQKDIEAIIHTFFSVVFAIFYSPDILHIHGIGPAIAVPFARVLGIKVVFTHHGPDYQRKKWGEFARVILKQGEFLGLKYADSVIAVSRANKRFLEKKYGRKDIVYMPNGVTLPQTVQGGEILKKYCLEPKRYVFTVCRFVPEKGLHDLVEAYKRINNREFKLVIAGRADHETEYSRKLEEDAQDAGVVLTGFLSGEPLAELYSNAGLFVLPSYYEGFPIVFLEALSYGLPLLVSDIPSNREIPLPEFRYFRAGDIDDLSGKIQELIKKGISQTEKETYKEILDRDYSWDKISESTFKLFKSV